MIISIKVLLVSALVLTFPNEENEVFHEEKSGVKSDEMFGKW